MSVSSFVNSKQRTDASVSSSLIIHAAICDSCDFPIIGVRFHCLQCPDFDLCEDCERMREDALCGSHTEKSRPKAGPIHDLTHVFLVARRPLLPPEERPNVSISVKPAITGQIVHRGLVCGHCSMPIIGSRFSCVNCASPTTGFDMCEACESSGVADVPFEATISVSAEVPILFQPSDCIEATTGKHIALPLDHPNSRELPSGEIFIRRMNTEQDVVAVIWLERECFRHPYADKFFCKARNQRSSCTILVACVHTVTVDQPAICGYVAVTSTKSRVVEITSLAVHSSARRKGVGALLLNAGLQHAKKISASAALLHCSVYNHAALSLYKRTGFKPVRWLPNYYVDDKEDAVLMQIDL